MRESTKKGGLAVFPSGQRAVDVALAYHFREKAVRSRPIGEGRVPLGVTVPAARLGHPLLVSRRTNALPC